MTKSQVIDTDPEVASPRRNDRKKELEEWDRSKGEALAKEEGITLTDDHWEVIVYLRHHYLEHGQPESAREIAMKLDEAFDKQGGQRYLRKLFPEGPVTQGSRIAGLPVPPYNQDESFGIAY